MIGNIKKTQAILDKYDLRAKKNYGQNFLVDENILRKILQNTNPSKDDGVIEVGPGIGALTELLLANYKKVLAIEIDTKLISVLNEELKTYQNLKLINQDILKVDLNDELQYFSDCKRIIVISNLPYYITTPIILKFLGTDYPIEEFYFMVQKEVGDRLFALEGTKDYGSLTVLINYRARGQILFPVSKNSFLPCPQVDSVIIKLKKQKVDLGIKDEANFLKFIHNIFSQRRKTLVNNLVGVYSLEKLQLQQLLKTMKINEKIRSENLSLLEISTIYKNIFEAPN
ncbi:MAG: 16S rRNA (adenine(1518)-N(6)/adenine(1519)-N(6))-dimethyltransferase RsmA [Bacilli bacterium]|nr:16S rRNA (adenine(1518)-N(6)/adenine(1519)-N(6))-dimethyltransferase RsmA [Bacilli bacterium]